MSFLIFNNTKLGDLVSGGYIISAVFPNIFGNNLIHFKSVIGQLFGCFYFSN